MAFNNLGDFWLGPGESTRISLAFDLFTDEPEWGGHDHGAQWIMADPISIAPATLLVKDHTKEHKPRRGQPGEPIVVYTVTVVNIGNESAHFSLQGGGCA